MLLLTLDLENEERKICLIKFSPDSHTQCDLFFCIYIYFTRSFNFSTWSLIVLHHQIASIHWLLGFLKKSLHKSLVVSIEWVLEWSRSSIPMVIPATLKQHVSQFPFLLCSCHSGINDLSFIKVIASKM